MDTRKMVLGPTDTGTEDIETALPLNYHMMVGTPRHDQWTTRHNSYETTPYYLPKSQDEMPMMDGHWEKTCGPSFFDQGTHCNSDESRAGSDE